MKSQRELLGEEWMRCSAWRPLFFYPAPELKAVKIMVEPPARPKRGKKPDILCGGSAWMAIMIAPITIVAVPR
jgi:hypothetical protein